ncbi:hypothetical protein BU16DRAFT_534846 [Lophium mytilinum]|uniref:F-box domain-containing protein n=1 Tax=Lophium mytilinum TaxID=390894 RepID=A0A6A6R6M1_9PEZI|nr:hypothetical protein BU16DRAFT_534846 [Lophium mytilinum]
MTDASQVSLHHGRKRTKMAPPWRHPSFRFLDLPREIRDIVYGILMTNSRSGSEGLFHSIKDRHAPKARLKSRPGRPLKPRTALLCVNKQIYEEAKEALYTNNVFSVALAQNNLRFTNKPVPGPFRFEAILPGASKAHNEAFHNEFDRKVVAPSKNECPSQPAIPFGWDLTAIRYLHVQIYLEDTELEYAQSEPCYSGAYAQMSKLSWESFHKMGKLVNLSVRLLFLDDSPPTLLRFCLGIGPAPMQLRHMLRGLVAAVPRSAGEIRWGCGVTKDELKWFEKVERSAEHFAFNDFDGNSYEMVDGKALEKLVVGLDAIRGIDADYEAEYPAEREAEEM